MSVVFGPGLGRQPGEGVLLADTNPVDQAPIVVQAVDSQSGNLMEFRDASGNVLSSIDSSGAMGGTGGAVILAPAASSRNVIQPSSDTATPLTLEKHSAAHSVNLFQIVDETGATVLSRFMKDGNLQISPTAASNATALFLEVPTTSGGSHLKARLPDMASDTIFSIQSITGFGGNIVTISPEADGGMVEMDLPPGATSTEQLWLRDSSQVGGTSTRWALEALGGMRWGLKDAANQQNIVCRFDPGYQSNVHASWQGKFTLSAVDFNSQRTVMVGASDGTSPMAGFLGAAPVVRQTNGTAADLAAIADAPAKAFITALSTALVNLGLLNAPA